MGGQNSGFATHPTLHAPSLCFPLSLCLSSGNKLFFLYQETATQLVHCHTLTDFASHTIHNHCDQLSSCSQMTVSIWCTLCGFPGSDGRQSHLETSVIWLDLYASRVFYSHFLLKNVNKTRPINMAVTISTNIYMQNCKHVQGHIEFFIHNKAFSSRFLTCTNCSALTLTYIKNNLPSCWSGQHLLVLLIRK